MKIKTFDGKKTRIRKLARKDLQHIKKFQDFINSLVEEDVRISRNKKMSLENEKRWLEQTFKSTRKRQQVFLIAECDGMVVGTASVELGKGRMEHVGHLGISIRRDYRGLGIGKFLMRNILKMARKELKPRPKVIRLSVFPDNKPVINLYEKFGFKKVARIPNQIRYKNKIIDEIIMLLYL